MSEVPEVFDVFEKKLAQVLSFTLVTHPNSTKKAVEELLTYFSSVVERASKAEARIAELEAAQRWRVIADGELPEYKRPYDYYLVCDSSDGTYQIAERNDHGEDWIFQADLWSSRFVTHWMPLPQPPEVQE